MSFVTISMSVDICISYFTAVIEGHKTNLNKSVSSQHIYKEASFHPNEPNKAKQAKWNETKQTTPFKRISLHYIDSVTA